MRTWAPAVALITCSLLPAIAQEPTALRAGVVRITAETDGKRKTGSGFIAKIDGDSVYIVTAAHVIGDAADPQVEFFTRQNDPVSAMVVKLEQRVDLALLKVKGVRNATALPLDKAGPSTNDEVIAIGFPQGGGGAWLISKGDVSGRDGPYWVISGNAIDQGSSGGPLVKNGNVIGVVQSMQGKFARAMPASIVAETLDGWGIALAEPAPEAARPLESKDDAEASASDRDAIALVKQAAAQGDPNSQFVLAEMYYEGNGVPQNFNEAAKWLSSAANAGAPTAQFVLGFVRLLQASGHAKNQQDALRAFSGYKTSGTPIVNIDQIQIKDEAAYREARQWLTKSAELGSLEALGVLMRLQQLHPR